MKKLVIFAALFVFLVIIGLSIFIFIKFSSLGDIETTQSVDTALYASSVEQYAAEKYPGYTAVYDVQNNILTLQKQTDFSIESAPSVYTDPASYLSQVQILTMDISAMCSEPELTVVLCYLSKDGTPMYSVASNGTVTKYWEKSAA